MPWCRACFLLPLPLLAACAAGQGPYPSLAPRAVEKETPVEQAPPPAPAASDPRLAALLSDLLGRAREGNEAFGAALPAAARAAYAAGAAGSESWVEAQQAVSRLEAARAPTVTALAELDALLLRRNSEGVPANDADLSALQAAVADIQAMVDRQSSEIERLSGTLSGV